MPRIYAENRHGRRPMALTEYSARIRRFTPNTLQLQARYPGVHTTEAMAQALRTPAPMVPLPLTAVRPLSSHGPPPKPLAAPVHTLGHLSRSLPANITSLDQMLPTANEPCRPALGPEAVSIFRKPKATVQPKWRLEAELVAAGAGYQKPDQLLVLPNEAVDHRTMLRNQALAHRQMEEDGRKYDRMMELHFRIQDLMMDNLVPA
uniref:Uncharacterized protein n=1 Tax=Eutreptiella gymnastica TaxID=73025 RepID=A0A7S1NKA9_9EUGL